MNESQSQSSVSLFQIRKPRITLDKDVILTSQTRCKLDEAIGAMKFHTTIYHDWGFGAVDPMGRNMVLNLYGPPGTGKTLAAEALAGTLGREFIHIGIAELESKYVGDTAKNIAAAFAAARTESAVIFFDEADTLLGARLSSVTQGIDNEINAMRSTLLLELERFDGVVIFATNFAKNYDHAFVSRIRYHIEFQLPDLACRRQLWQRLLVLGVPLAEDRDTLIERCAEQSHGLSGREIRNVLRTAFPKALMAGDDDPKVLWEHLSSAIHDVNIAQRNVGKHQQHDTRNGSDESVTAGVKMLGLAN
ncbi:ATP-binding protein [Aeromonas allosaccharophila]|uniref:ATP-binding protein n=1 Tax=Aeromonas allosaccharophila TaxID=656 RepID=UPI003D1B849A